MYCKKLKKLKSGPDSVLNEVIKFSSLVTTKAYAQLFNLMLKTGYYPTSRNSAYITLVHKSGDKCKPSNYRGISLTVYPNYLAVS